MIRFIRLLFVFIAVMSGATNLVARDSSTPRINPARAAVVEGVIFGQVLDPVAEFLAALDPSKGPADLIIQSPGGSVVTGFWFTSELDAVRARGLRVRCFVPKIAASMAFQIFLHCDERYVLSKSFLLWHRARISVGGMFGTAMTSPELIKLGRDLANTDQLIINDLKKYVAMPTEDMMYHFESETLHVGENLARMAPDSFTSYDYIPGLFEAIGDEKVTRSKRESSLFGLYRDLDVNVEGLFPAGEIICVPHNHPNLFILGRSELTK